ncbi:MAG: alanine racemase [Bryobacterales bacterium]|nr:alanine racemase [Bryobacterales bacterium]
MTLPNHRTWAEISLARIAANYHALRTAAGPECQLAPVVKADAYRHGAAAVALRLQAEGARWFAVSNTSEGAALRESGITADVLVMGDFLDFERSLLACAHLTPVIHSVARLRELNSYAGATGLPLTYHLKIDTGMGRLGARATLDELLQAVRDAAYLRLTGLMTHFASANDFVSPQTADQITAFEAAVAKFTQSGLAPPLLHLSSSGPVAFQIRRAYGTLVRPGLALYGYVSPARGAAPQLPLDLQPALTWKARIVEIKNIPTGDSVGYGAQWRAARPTRMAVVAAGYADGVPHQLSNRGHVAAAGRLLPMLGAVSMDLITIDVTDGPQLQIGDAVTLLGRDGEASYDANEMAAEAGIISYAVLCGLGNRVARVYVD